MCGLGIPSGAFAPEKNPAARTRYLAPLGRNIVPDRDRPRPKSGYIATLRWHKSCVPESRGIQMRRPSGSDIVAIIFGGGAVAKWGRLGAPCPPERRGLACFEATLESFIGP